MTIKPSTIFTFICISLMISTSIININAAELNWKNESQYNYTLIYPSTNVKSNFFMFEQDGKTGLVDQNGNIAIPAIYDYLTILNENLVSVVNSDYMGVLDCLGNEIIPIEYDANWSDNCNLINGCMIRVIKNDNVGLTDLKGNWIIPLSYEWISEFDASGKYIIGRKNEMYNLMDNDANIIYENYEDISTMYGTDKYIRITQNGFCGVADYNGNIVVPMEYERIDFIKDNIFAVKKYDQWGLIDIENNVIIPLEYKWIGRVADDLVDCYTFDEKDYLFSISGDFIAESQYYISDTYISTNSLIIVEDNGKYGAMNRNNQIIIPMIYESLETFSETLFTVEKDGLYGLIDLEGNIVLPIEYTELIDGKDSFDINYNWDTEDLCIITKYDNESDLDLFGLINSNGDVIFYPQYNSIYLFNKNYFIVSKDGYEGIIDMNGNEVIPIEYASIIPGINVLAVLEENSGWKFAEISEDESNDKTVVTSFGSTASSWAVPEIESAFENNLIPEVLIGYDLTEKVNRGEFAAIAVQLYETLSEMSVPEASNCRFLDISNDINEKAIRKAYRIEVAQGTSSTTYEPLSNINREQLATMLCRVIKKYNDPSWTMANDSNYYMDTLGIRKFADDSEISDWAKPSVYFMVKFGIIKGISDTHFAPKNTTTQQEASGYATATREQAIILAQRIFTQSDIFGI